MTTYKPDKAYEYDYCESCGYPFDAGDAITRINHTDLPFCGVRCANNWIIAAYGPYDGPTLLEYHDAIQRNGRQDANRAYNQYHWGNRAVEA